MRLVARAVDEFGQLDVLVNNAGISKIGPLSEVDVDGWSAMIDVNLRGVLYGIAAAPGSLRNDRVNRRTQNHPQPGSLRGHRECGAHSHGRAATGIDGRRSADHRYRRDSSKPNSTARSITQHSENRSAAT